MISVSYHVCHWKTMEAGMAGKESVEGAEGKEEKKERSKVKKMKSLNKDPLKWSARVKTPDAGKAFFF